LAPSGDRSAFLIVVGQVEIQHGDSRVTLGPGQAFAATELFSGCLPADAAVTAAHTKILKLGESQIRVDVQAQAPRMRAKTRRRAARSRKPPLRPVGPEQAG
jgi:hypothetical protein